MKTGFSGADVVIGTSHALEDFSCNDPICGTIDIVGSVSTAVGLVLGNIPATKHLTLITGSVTVGCRSIRLDTTVKSMGYCGVVQLLPAKVLKKR